MLLKVIASAESEALKGSTHSHQFDEAVQSKRRITKYYKASTNEFSLSRNPAITIKKHDCQEVHHMILLNSCVHPDSNSTPFESHESSSNAITSFRDPGPHTRRENTSDSSSDVSIH